MIRTQNPQSFHHNYSLIMFCNGREFFLIIILSTFHPFSTIYPIIFFAHSIFSHSLNVLLYQIFSDSSFIFFILHLYAFTTYLMIMKFETIFLLLDFEHHYTNKHTICIYHLTFHDNQFQTLYNLTMKNTIL